jgi:hypothetical protein
LIASRVPVAGLRFLFVLVAFLVVAPATAWADGKRVIRDCTDDGRVQGRYSQSEYRDALAHMPTDVDEYTDCRDVIRRAQLAAAGGRGKGNAGGPRGSATDVPAAGSDPLATASPTEKTRATRAIRGGSAPVVVGGRVLRPGALGARTPSATSDLPTPLLVVLLLLGTGALALAGMRAGSRVLARRRT